LEPKVGRRLIDLLRTGNQYVAAIVSTDPQNPRIAIREISQSPENASRISFPGHHRPAETKERAYVRGTFFRYGAGEEDLEEEGEEVEEETPSPEEAIEETEAAEEPLPVDTEEGLVAIDAAKQISTFSAAVLSATLDRTGPIRDKLVPLADGLTDLGKDSQSYGDGGDPAAFARVLADVTAGWQRVRDLAALLPKDDAIQATLGRGSSFVVTAKAEPRATITAGPFGR